MNPLVEDRCTLTGLSGAYTRKGLDPLMICAPAKNEEANNATFAALIYNSINGPSQQGPTTTSSLPQIVQT